jgi:hypothetical protein
MNPGPRINFRGEQDMTSPPSSTDSLKSDFDDQQVWRACIGLDLADRTVLEAEVLIWRIVQHKSALTHQCARSRDCT